MEQSNVTTHDNYDNIDFGDATKMINVVIIEENILIPMSLYCSLTNIGMYFIYACTHKKTIIAKLKRCLGDSRFLQIYSFDFFGY